MSRGSWLPGVPENVEEADWIHLTENETVRWTGRPSPYTITVSIAMAAGIAVAGLLLTGWLVPVVERNAVPIWIAYLPLLLTLGGLLSAIRTYLNWIRLLYVITDEEIYVKHGLVSRDVTQVRLTRVQNTAYSQSIVERLLSYGDIKVFTAGTSTEDLVFKSVPHPERVKRTLTDLLSEHDQGMRTNP